MRVRVRRDTSMTSLGIDPKLSASISEVHGDGASESRGLGEACGALAG
jgi:hypothetical protein